MSNNSFAAEAMLLRGPSWPIFRRLRGQQHEQIDGLKNHRGSKEPEVTFDSNASPGHSWSR